MNVPTVRLSILASSGPSDMSTPHDDTGRHRNAAAPHCDSGPWLSQQTLGNRGKEMVEAAGIELSASALVSSPE